MVKTSRASRSQEIGKLKKPSLLDGLDECKYMEERELNAFFSVIKSKRDKAIFRIMYHHGLRAHEIGLIQVSDYEERDCILYIRRGKGSVSRQHALIDNEVKPLRAWLKERGTTPGFLFPSRQGSKGISRRRLDQLMKIYCRLARIPAVKAHCHALKHSCGTQLSERGASPAEIQDWLGHRDPASTAIYTHFSAKRRAASVEKHKNW